MTHDRDESDPDDGTWNSYRRMVVQQLKDLKDAVAALTKSVDELTRDVGTIKVKAALIGTALGSIFGAVVAWFLGRKA